MPPPIVGGCIVTIGLFIAISGLIFGLWVLPDQVDQGREDLSIFDSGDSERLKDLAAPEEVEKPNINFESYWFFNIKNVDDFKNGSMPIVEEKGPYRLKNFVYWVAFSFSEDESSVSFKQTDRSYFVPPEDGSLSLDDVLCTPNGPYLAAVKLYGGEQSMITMAGVGWASEIMKAMSETVELRVAYRSIAFATEINGIADSDCERLFSNLDCATTCPGMTPMNNGDLALITGLDASTLCADIKTNTLAYTAYVAAGAPDNQTAPWTAVNGGTIVTLIAGNLATKGALVTFLGTNIETIYGHALLDAGPAETAIGYAQFASATPLFGTATAKQILPVESYPPVFPDLECDTVVGSACGLTTDIAYTLFGPGSKSLVNPVGGENLALFNVVATGGCQVADIAYWTGLTQAQCGKVALYVASLGAAAGAGEMVHQSMIVGSGPIACKTVGQLLFDNVDSYLNIVAPTLAQNALRNNYTIAEAQEKEPVYSYLTGKLNVDDTWRIIEYRDETNLVKWWGTGAPDINFLNYDKWKLDYEPEEIIVWVAAMKRPVVAKKVQATTYKGIDVNEYRISDKTFATSAESEFSAPYNVKAKGVYDASSVYGFNIAMVQPHCLNADETYCTAQGLTPPVVADHDTYFYNNPFTGFTMAGRFRMMTMVEFEPTDGFVLFDFPSSRVPFFTMEISSEISDENAADFVEALDQIEFYGTASKVYAPIGGSLIVMVGAFLTLKAKGHKKRYVRPVRPEKAKPAFDAKNFQQPQGQQQLQTMQNNVEMTPTY